MTSPLLALATSIVRAWTRLYTSRLPRELREARRAEIESDLWEFHTDSAEGRYLNPTLHVLARLVFGIPDDLRWRAEHAPGAGRPLRTGVALAAVALVISAGVVLVSLQQVELPHPPAAAPLRWRPILIPGPPPPPPPPPPAPCADWSPATGCRR